MEQQIKRKRACQLCKTELDCCFGFCRVAGTVLADPNKPKKRTRELCGKCVERVNIRYERFCEYMQKLAP